MPPGSSGAVVSVAKTFHKQIDERHHRLELHGPARPRPLGSALSVTHKRLDELHPADVADILEQLDPQQRANVFKHLDESQATEAISEMEDEYQADFIEDLDDAKAANVLGNMDPDDAVDIVRDLSYEKAEALLRLMGSGRRRRDSPTLGYKDGTAAA